MEENFAPENVRQRLILAGLKELDKYGIKDFSLRRVAIEAGVSCAAPYRHFKDKDELISAIARYVIDGWRLLSEQIASIYLDDARALVKELLVAGLRFWIANSKFRTAFFTNIRSEEALFYEPSEFDAPIIRAVDTLAEREKREDKELLTFKVLALLYGAVAIVESGCGSADAVARNLRISVEDIIG